MKKKVFHISICLCCPSYSILFHSIIWNPYVLANHLSLSVRRLGSDESEAYFSEAEKGYVPKLAFANAVYIILVQFIQVLNIHQSLSVRRLTLSLDDGSTASRFTSRVFSPAWLGFTTISHFLSLIKLPKIHQMNQSRNCLIVLLDCLAQCPLPVCLHTDEAQ